MFILEKEDEGRGNGDAPATLSLSLSVFYALAIYPVTRSLRRPQSAKGGESFRFRSPNIAFSSFLVLLELLQRPLDLASVFRVSGRLLARIKLDVGVLDVDTGFIPDYPPC